MNTLRLETDRLILRKFENGDMVAAQKYIGYVPHVSIKP